MKHKILGVAALLCAMLFAACSDLLEDLTPKETSSVEVETTADTDLYVNILEISGDFTLESEQSGTELRFTALDTEPGANLVWKVYKGLEDTAYTQSGSDTSFGFDTGDLEPGKYTLLVTSGTRSATAVFTVNTTGTVPVTLKTGGAINSILMQLCPGSGDYSACTKFARSETNKDEATLYLDTEGKYIPVWSDGTVVYYYVPDGCTPVMNEDSSKMFFGCMELTSLDVTGFDTSNVTNMSEMFAYCSLLASLDVSKFVTSKVENMSGMFSGCYELKSLDVTGFDTSNVKSMNNMFSGCSKLTSLDLSKFDTSNVTDMSVMFYGCEGLTIIYATDKFVTTSVNRGDYCFYNCSKLRGGAGTTYDYSRTSADYARIDGGTDAPGYFTLKPIGSKSKPDAVGDIVFSDGSATPYTADLTLTEEEKAAAIAVIFYKGTGLNSGDDTSTSRTLGVGLKHNKDYIKWCLYAAAAYSKSITTIQCPADGYEGELTFTGDKNGSDNLKQISDFLISLGKTDDTGTAENYPAFYFGKNYKDTATNIAGTDYESGWYLPSLAELFQIYANGKGASKVFDIDAAITLCGGDTFGTSAYWSSSQDTTLDNYVRCFIFDHGDCCISEKDSSYDYVCAVRAFK